MNTVFCTSHLSPLSRLTSAVSQELRHFLSVVKRSRSSQQRSVPKITNVKDQ